MVTHDTNMASKGHRANARVGGLPPTQVLSLPTLPSSFPKLTSELPDWRKSLNFFFTTKMVFPKSSESRSFKKTTRVEENQSLRGAEKPWAWSTERWWSRTRASAKPTDLSGRTRSAAPLWGPCSRILLRRHNKAERKPVSPQIPRDEQIRRKRLEAKTGQIREKLNNLTLG